MVLLGTTSDMRTIHVRTDDLSPRERGQVHECVDLIHKFKLWNSQGTFVGITTFLCIIVVALIGILIGGAFWEINNDTAIRALVTILFPAVVAGIGAWGFAADSANKRLREGVQALIVNMLSSPRCDEFVREYMEDCVLTKRLLADHLKPATSSV